MFKSNLAYEASAGSGKTFMLVVRYLSLLFQGANPSKILALTFTNKAAFEMQERVFKTLQSLETRDELEEIIKVTEIPREELLKNKEKILEHFLNANVKIMTIDKFFTQILRKFSLYVSLMPDFSTHASNHELKLLERFLKEVSVAGKKETLLSLSLESSKRLENIFQMLETLSQRKHEFRAFEFNKENFLEYEDKALRLLKNLEKIVEQCKEASSTAKKGVKASNFQELLKKKWLERESMNYSTFKKCYIQEMDTILEQIKECVREYNYAKEASFFHGLYQLLGIYEKAKKALYMEDSELSFADVSSLVYHILKEIEDSEFLYFRLDARIEHILLDEFQDTSILQYEILKPIIDEITSGSGIFENGSFFFVGDVKQSIYRFRGGVSALFHAVKEQQNTDVEKLLVNYRSQKEVIEFVNDTFRSKIRNYTDQKTREQASHGYVEVIKDDDVLNKTIEQVQNFLSLGANINHIAILCATNNDGEEIKQRLIDSNIEVVTETTTKLISQKSVKALIEYLKYLYFNKEIYRHNFFSLIHQDVEIIPKVDFSKQTLFELVKKAIEKYNLFHNDFHLIRFLDHLQNFQDIESFLFEYERIDIEAAASDLQGVRVLTVHKSKGLEYEHVILMDRLKNPPPSRNPIIYEYDGIDLQRVYLRISGRDAIDELYKNALSKEQSLVREDTLNALYVACTRARENLIIIAKPEKSSFDILELEVSTRGELIVSNNTDVSDNVKEAKAFLYKELYYGTQNEILKLEDNTQENLDAINFGLAMHFMLEMLGGFEKKYLDDAYNMMFNKYGSLLEEKQLYDIKKRVTLLLENKKFLNLVSGKVYKEKAIRYKNNLRYLDLLVENSQEDKKVWNILDYKSSISYSEHHLKQVRYYKKAIGTITKEDVSGYLCYLLEDEIKLVEV